MKSYLGIHIVQSVEIALTGAFRSSEFQEEYDNLRAEVEAAETNAQTNLNKRRDIAMEKREAKQEAGEAKKYQSHKEDLVRFIQLVLFIAMTR